MLVYYRIYSEDGAIPSKTPATPSDLFLGRIKATSVPPPHTVKAVKHKIERVEGIKHSTSSSLFLTPYKKSPMGDSEKLAILNPSTGSESTAQEPLELVAKMSNSERSALEAGRRGGLKSAVSDTTSPEIQYRTSHSTLSFFSFRTNISRVVFYRLYAIDSDDDLPSKVAFDPGESSLGRIRVDSVAPPHSPISIKRCISRVEEIPELAYANLFSGDTLLKEGHISLLRTDDPGLSRKKAMAIVQVEIPIPDGRYVIKNRAADIFWNSGFTDGVYTTPNTLVKATDSRNVHLQVSKHSPIIQVFNR